MLTAAGDELIAMGRLDEADAYFEDLARQHPDDPDPLHGLVRVGRARRDSKSLADRLQRLLHLEPNLIGEKAAWLRIVGMRGDIERVHRDLPRLLDLADRGPLDRSAGRQLLFLVQFSLIGSRRTAALLRLLDIAQANSSGDFDRSKKFWKLDGMIKKVARGVMGDGKETALRAPVGMQRSMLALKAEIQLALGDYDDFALTVETINDSDKPRQFVRDIRRVRQKISCEHFPDFQREKVFGIGLSRSGTTSLNIALDALGYHSVHFSNPMTMDLIDDKDFLLFDAFTDISVSHRFEWLYHTFPNSRFVFTSRPLDSWVKSVSFHYRNIRAASHVGSIMTPAFRKNHEYRSARMFMNLYGSFASWADAHAAYHERVSQFFRDKPRERFLELRITEGEGYEKLCTFLGRPVPESPFPNANKSPAANMVRASAP